MRLPWWLSGKECSCQCRRHGFGPWSGKILWKRKWQSTPVFLPGKPHGQGILMSYSPWGGTEFNKTLQLNNNMSIDGETKGKGMINRKSETSQF